MTDDMTNHPDAMPVVDVFEAQNSTRHRLMNAPFIAGVTIIGLLSIGAILGPALISYDPRAADILSALEFPSSEHFFGTDTNGSDIFVRTLAAARIDLTIPAAGVLLALLSGVPLGLVAGLTRGVLGEVLMRFTDLLQAFPLLILAIAIVALTGNNLTNVIWAIAFVNIPIFLRLTRSQVLTIRELRYVEASIALGNTRTRLIARHIFPNAIGPVIVQVGISMGYGILLLAALAFLGVGVQVPTPEWGSMILIGAGDIVTGQWWTSIFPGVVLILAVAGFNLISEGVERARSLQ
jgi:peptide/nickel transport system permease protein